MTEKTYLLLLIAFIMVCIGAMIWAAWHNHKDEEHYGGDDNEGFETNPNKKNE
ncbi:MAG: hypothetical protein NT066_06600 [Candidatus Omnitrophica bacterium]|nr:hypothetical protein [Candidatus Omnitrophota bacterium]